VDTWEKTRRRANLRSVDIQRYLRPSGGVVHKAHPDHVDQLRGRAARLGATEVEVIVDPAVVRFDVGALRV
jgi:hypothetical protein